MAQIASWWPCTITPLSKRERNVFNECNHEWWWSKWWKIFLHLLRELSLCGWAPKHLRPKSTRLVTCTAFEAGARKYMIYIELVWFGKLPWNISNDFSCKALTLPSILAGNSDPLETDGITFSATDFRRYCMKSFDPSKLYYHKLSSSSNDEILDKLHRHPQICSCCSLHTTLAHLLQVLAHHAHQPPFLAYLPLAHWQKETTSFHQIGGQNNLILYIFLSNGVESDTFVLYI